MKVQLPYSAQPRAPWDGRYRIEGNVVIGEVVHVTISERIANSRLHVDPAALHAIGRMAGDTYARTADRFDIARGRKALEGPLS